MSYKKLIEFLGFNLKENKSGIYQKKYANSNYIIEIDFEKETINYGNLIKIESKTTQNFSPPENFVVLECVDRLLEKGYKPENIILEKTWATGHGTSGRLDILVTRDDGSAYLMIECKTYGKEFEKEFTRIKKDGGQLFTYFQQDRNADILMLYSSELKNSEVIYKNEIIKIEPEYRPTSNVKDFYERWSKLTKDNGVFDSWVKPYDFESKALTINDLVEIKQEDSSFIFNQFLEILRHNVVSDKGNAFNKIFTLFLCKIYDEKSTKKNEELKFQWKHRIDNHIVFQKRLTDLYKKGMKEFLEKEVSDLSDSEFEDKFGHFIQDQNTKQKILDQLTELRLKKNNEFAIKEVFDDASFQDNAVVVKEVVELLQKFKIRYTKRHQYLSDFFELLLTTGLKQESGQFFTPVPIAQFIIKSIPLDKLVVKKLNKGDSDDLLPTIIDYAAGSGHFLTESMHEIQGIINKISPDDFIDKTARELKKWHSAHFDWAFDYVYGIEKDYRLVKVGKVGCYLHGDGLAKVIHGDGLGSFTKTAEYKDLLKKTDKYFPKENKQFDIVLSNPPYSVSSFKNNARKFYTEEDFELYGSLTDNSSEIECLFIERTKQLLKDGGIAGIILPSSILSNTGIYTKAREIILQYFDIVGITELGSNTFMATGTNTVVLFLRRRNNEKIERTNIFLKNALSTFQDLAINGIERPISKYINLVWESIDFDDYISLLKSKPNEQIEKHEIYIEYRKKIKAKNDKEFFEIVLEKEKEKLFYFVLTYPQKVVLIKTGEKDVEKRFLGYEFSNRRGSEGIHPMQRGKHIEDCTKLFDSEVFDNPEKASTYIYKAFTNDFDFPIHESLENNISRHDLVDMLTFDRVDFEKTLSLNIKKKVKIQSKWELIKIGDICETSSGGTPKSGQHDYYDNGSILWVNSGEVRNGVIFDTEKKITEKGLKESSAKIFPKNTVLVAMYGATTGQVGILGVEASTNQAVCGILPSENISHNFLYYYLRTQLKNFTDLSYGVARLNISQEVIKNFKIPLPPIEIQKEIVSEIEVLEKKEEKTKKEAEALRGEIESIVQSVKGESKKLGEVLTLEYGEPLPEQSRILGEYPVMGSNGIVGYHNEYFIQSPSIIVGRKGSAGKVTWIDKNSFPIDTTFFVKLINPKTELKLIYYILKFINLEKISGGTGVPGLNRNNAYGLKIKLPLIEEQKEIVSKIEKLEEKINELEKEISLIPAQKEEVLKQYL